MRVPIISLTEAAPASASTSGNLSLSRTEAVGSKKLAVPICTALAPATRNSITSSSVAMPPMPMIGTLTCARDLPDQAQGQRLDRRPAQAAGDVAEDRPAAAPVDGHADEGVDQRNGVGPGVGGGLGDGHDVGHVRRQLGDQRQRADRTHAATTRARHVADRWRSRRRRRRSGTTGSAPAPPGPARAPIAAAISTNSSSVLPAMLAMIAVGSVRR